VSQEKWVVLMEHLLPVAWVPIDGVGAEMLFVESELLSSGIEVAFDPRRPGEGFYSYGMAQPLRLMVKECDLVKVTEILQDISSTGA